MPSLAEMTGLELVQAVCAEPDDDGLRLVFADFCEDNGESERAEFVRLGVELTRTFGLQQKGGVALTGDRTASLAEYAMLRRQAALLNAIAPGAGCLASYVWAKPLPSVTGVLGWSWSCGFVESVTMTAESWLAHADTVIACHPVTRVNLTTWPRVRTEGGDVGMVCYLPGHKVAGRCVSMHRPEFRCRDVADLLLTKSWPGIVFHLPEGPVDNLGEWD